MKTSTIALLAACMALLATVNPAEGPQDSPAARESLAEEGADSRYAVISAMPAAMTTLDGTYTQAQADRGKEIHLEHCAGCHGANMRGAGTMGPSVVGGRFERRWAEMTVADLFDDLKETMPMGEPGKLTDLEYADVLAYILFRNEYPVSTTVEIPVDPAAQALITIVGQ